MLIQSKSEGLVSLTAKQFKKEKKLFNSINSSKSIIGLWTAGGFEDAPLSFKNTDIIINWSLLEIKAEFFVNSIERSTFLPFYFNTIYYGEWGELEEKPIIFMEIETEDGIFKSKTPFKFRELWGFLKKNIKLTIYFESVLLEDPEKKSAWEGNVDWISHVGGLYNVIDLSYWIENNEVKLIEDESEPDVNSGEKYTKNIWFLSVNRSINVDFYDYNNEIKEVAFETLTTALEMKKHGLNWKKFAASFLNI